MTDLQMTEHESTGSRQRARLLAIGPVPLTLLWLLTTVLGTAAFFADQNRPGARGAVPVRWPAGSGIARVPGQPLLLVFLHPNCPCSGASVRSLQLVLDGLPASSRPRTVFVLRANAANDWRAERLLKTASQTGNSVSVEDGEQREARLFGAEVSGLTLLYDAQGRLAFDGGVTAERGQEGRSRSSEALWRVLKGPSGVPARTPVFGCALGTSGSVAGKGAKSCPRR
jgi:hypothetical protein